MDEMHLSARFFASGHASSSVRSYSGKPVDSAYKGPSMDDTILAMRTAARGRHVDWIDDERHYELPGGASDADEKKARSSSPISPRPTSYAQIARKSVEDENGDTGWLARARVLLQRQGAKAAEAADVNEDEVLADEVTAVYGDDGVPTRRQLLSLVYKLQEQITYAREQQDELRGAMQLSQDAKSRRWRAMEQTVEVEQTRRSSHRSDPDGRPPRMFLGAGSRAATSTHPNTTHLHLYDCLHGGHATSGSTSSDSNSAIYSGTGAETEPAAPSGIGAPSPVPEVTVHGTSSGAAWQLPSSYQGGTHSSRARCAKARSSAPGLARALLVKGVSEASF